MYFLKVFDAVSNQYLFIHSFIKYIMIQHLDWKFR